MSLKSVRTGRFDVLLERLYGMLFRAQVEKDWKAVDKIQRDIGYVEKREGEVATNPQDLRDYEGAVR